MGKTKAEYEALAKLFSPGGTGVESLRSEMKRFPNYGRFPQCGRGFCYQLQ